MELALKRPVGSSGPFKQDAELPTYLAGDGKPTKNASKLAGRRPKKRHVRERGPLQLSGHDHAFPNRKIVRLDQRSGNLRIEGPKQNGRRR